MSVQRLAVRRVQNLRFVVGQFVAFPWFFGVGDAHQFARFFARSDAKRSQTEAFGSFAFLFYETRTVVSKIKTARATRIKRVARPYIGYRNRFVLGESRSRRKAKKGEKEYFFLRN